MSRFAHLPPGSFLSRINDDVKAIGTDAMEVSPAMAKVYKELSNEKAHLVTIVANLNRVNTIRKGKKRLNVLDIEEEGD